MSAPGWSCLIPEGKTPSWHFGMLGTKALQTEWEKLAKHEGLCACRSPWH